LSWPRWPRQRARQAWILPAWKADEGVQKMVPKKPSTDNRKVGALLGRELVAPETSVQLAFATLKPGGHL